MWFIFPQLAELGHSEMAKKYGIANLEEARAYLAHPVLGSRLLECTDLMLATKGKSVCDILGTPDDFKFRSCMTLYQAAGQHPQWAAALTKYFGGKGDPATLDILSKQA